MIKHKIELFLKSKRLTQTVDLVQADSGREIECSFPDYTIPSGVTAKFCAIKPSGKSLFNKATVIGNTILVKVTNQMVAERGITIAQIKIERAGEMISTFSFYLRCEMDVLGDGTESMNESSVLDTILAEKLNKNQGKLNAGRYMRVGADGVLFPDVVQGIDGSVSYLEIQKAVNEYMQNNPIAETDPTVAQWAKELEKPTYTANEVGALGNNFGALNANKFLKIDESGNVIPASAPVTGGNGFSGDYNDLINKPKIPKKLSELTDDSMHRVVTDSEKQGWNEKASKDIATAQTDGLMSKTDKTKLDGIETNANNYVHPNDMNTRHVTDVEKETWNSLPKNKNEIGLGNVTNDAQIKRTEMGVANGVATLDGNGKILSAQLPSYVDDVLEFPNKSVFPVPGTEGKIYVDTSNNTTFRWSGTGYVQIKGDLTLGETSSTAYSGDKGKALADDVNGIKNGSIIVYTHPSHHNATMITEDATHRFVSDAEKEVWNAKSSLTEARVNELIDAKIPRSAEGVQY